MPKKKLINLRPYVFTAVSIILGVLCAKNFYTGNIFGGIISIVGFIGSFVLSVFFATGGNFKNKIWYMILISLLFAVGATTFTIQVTNFDNANLNEHYYTITAKISNAEKTEYGEKLTLTDPYVSGDIKGKIKYKIAVYVYGNVKADIGDVIRFQAYLSDNTSVYEGKFSSYNIENGVKYTASISSSEIMVVGNRINLFERTRLFIRDTLKAGLSEDTFSVAYAMLTGSTDDMDFEVLKDYRNAGVAHIFAVSGLHIGFLATTLGFIFSKLKMKRLLKAIIITLVLFFYSGVCGFSSSSLRASVMCAISLFCAIKGDRYDGVSSVALACTLILLCSPLELFNVGFQLSFVVVCGIIILSKPIAKLFAFFPEKVANALGAVISAQLAGIPVCLTAFGEFSLIALIANMIMIPVVGVVFNILLVGVLLGGLLTVPHIILFVPKYALMAITALITAFDYHIFMVGGFTFAGFALLYYLACIIPSGLINVKNLWRIISIAVCIVFATVGTVALNVNANSYSNAYVVGDKNVCATVITDRQSTVMVVSSNQFIWSAGRFERLKTTKNVTEIDTLVFLNDAVDDMQVFITKLRSVFALEQVCYYGYQKPAMEEIIKNSFNLDISNLTDGSIINTGKITVKYALEGYFADCKVNGQKIGVFAELNKDDPRYKGLTEKYDLLVAYDYVENIFSNYGAGKKVSYLNHSLYASAQNKGTFTYKFK